MTGLEIFVIGLVLVSILLNRKDIDVTVLRAKDAPYTKVSDTKYANRFTLHISNTSFDNRTVTVVSGIEGVEYKGANLTAMVPAGEDTRIEMFALYEADLLKSGKVAAPVQLIDSRGVVLWEEELSLVGPFN